MNQNLYFTKPPVGKKLTRNLKSFSVLLKEFNKNIEVFDEPSYFKDIPKHHQIIHETDMANSFQDFYKKSKKKMGKKLVEAIERGLKYSAKEYADAVDFMKQSYKSYSEVFEDYIANDKIKSVADKGLLSTGSPELSTIWTYMGLPSISLPLLTGDK